MPSREKKAYDSYASYIKKVQLQVHPDTKMSSASTAVLDAFVRVILKLISKQAMSLMKVNKRKTLMIRDIQTAVQFVITGELSKHAAYDGTKAVHKYDGYSSPPGASKKKAVSMSRRAGIVFSVSRVARHMRFYICADRFAPESAVYLAAVLEYIVAEMIELGGNVTRDDHMRTLTPRHILLGCNNDEELSELLRKSRVFVGAGVTPYIHPALWVEKKKKSNKSKKSDTKKKTSKKASKKKATIANA